MPTSPARPMLADLVFATALTIFLLVVEPVVAEPEGGFGRPGWALIVVAGMAFALRRASPFAVFALTWGALTVWIALGYPGGPIYAAAIGGTIVLVLAHPVRRAVALVAGGIAAWTVAGAASGVLEAHMIVVFPTWIAGAALLGEAHRARQGRVLAQQAQAIAEERLRIARDVHDVVGHSLATISLQAGVAEHLLDDDPEQARTALRTIRQVSRQSLGELSAMLGVLRGEAAERAPTPSLDAIPALVAGMRDAGLEIDARVQGADVPEVVGVAGYRIVQEALTNVVRHAGPGAKATVTVAAADGEIRIEVRDDGRGAGERAVEGSGLLGMRERAAAVGGSIETTPDLLGGGFRVRARLPIAGRAAREVARA